LKKDDEISAAVIFLKPASLIAGMPVNDQQNLVII
jgi:hypothetical protein